jgi:7-carboxy-7-deazaguanine synthase
MLAINEIFYSIQGEGDFAGQPMVFIRLAGCNLRCSWCDQPDTIANDYTDQAGKTWSLKFDKMCEEDIMLEVAKHPTKYVCITGGEPLTHKLEMLLKVLHSHSKWIHMESNGTLAPSWVSQVDHLVVSPKFGHSVAEDLYPYIAELKFIVDAHFSITEACVYASRISRASLYLQPANGKDRINIVALQRTMQLCLDNSHFKLSPQIHKLIGAH